jgi:hypothetical protein
MACSGVQHVDDHGICRCRRRVSDHSALAGRVGWLIYFFVLFLFLVWFFRVCMLGGKKNSHACPSSKQQTVAGSAAGVVSRAHPAACGAGDGRCHHADDVQVLWVRACHFIVPALFFPSLRGSCLTCLYENFKILRNSSIGDRSPSAIQRWPDIRWPLVETLARIVRLYPLAAGAGAARPLLLPVIRLASEAAKDGNRAEVPC